jgi:hypothetical protein
VSEEDPGVAVDIAVESGLDAAVLSRLAMEAGLTLAGPPRIKGGKPALLEKLASYNYAAQFTPWLVLIDLDHDADCAPTARELWLPRPAPRMCFRIVVKEIEAWLMADRQGLAQFLGVAEPHIPRDPEQERDPKQKMLQLAAKSSRREIREALSPQSKLQRVGPGYNPRLSEFVEKHWNPRAAAEHSDSLRRCMARFEELGRRA